MSDNSLIKLKKKGTYMEITEMWILRSICQRCPLYVPRVEFRNLEFKYMPPSLLGSDV